VLGIVALSPVIRYFSWFCLVYYSYFCILSLIVALMFYKRQFSQLLTVGAFLLSLELWFLLTTGLNSVQKLVGPPPWVQRLLTGITGHEFSPDRDPWWGLWIIASMTISMWIAVKCYRWLRRRIDLLELPGARRTKEAQLPQ